MLRLLADEDFNGRIVRGVRRMLPALELVQIQEVGLSSASDPEILEFAANSQRLLLTHDASTMPAHAHDRVAAGQPMPGLIVCPQRLSIGRAITDVSLLAVCSHENEWEGNVIYLPL